jgi:hypothetical protein
MNAFFRQTHRPASKTLLPWALEVSPPGFGYPLGDLRSSLLTVSPQLRSWAFPFRAFLLLNGRNKVPPIPLRSCAFSQNLLGLVPALQRFHPTQKAVPSFCLQRFRSDSGHLLSWAFSPLGSSLWLLQGKSFFLPFSLPLSLFKTLNLSV